MRLVLPLRTVQINTPVLQFCVLTELMRTLIRSVLIIAAVALLPVLAITWGDDGHRAINRVAGQKIAGEMPPFFGAAVRHIEYEGPEPDRWRSNLEKPLNDAQAPDHFIDLEYVDWLNPLPVDRHSYIRAVYERRAANPQQADLLLPEKIGFQPYITIEVFDRLKVAFREYRHAKERGLPTTDAELNAAFYAGWLGHYVADGANPLHTTKHYNGWVGDNPKGYPTDHEIHSKTESAFVSHNLQQLEFADLVKGPRHLDRPFEDYVAYLRDSQKNVERIYELEKACAFEGQGTPESREFIRQRLAAGAQMLANMWFTAWVDSKQEPEPYRPPKSDAKHRCAAPAAAASASVTK